MRFAGLLLLSAFYLGGCATVARGPNTKMVVDTEPQGAKVTTDLETKDSRKRRKDNPDMAAEYYGCPATPCEFKMSRRAMFIMTIDHPDHDPIQIGVDHSLHKESLNANLAGSAGTGVAVGVGTAAFATALGGGGAVTGSSAAIGGAVGLGAAAGVGVVSIGVDAATGSLLNLNPNPVFIALPPKGTEIVEDPRIRVVQEKRAGTYKQYKKQLKAQEKAAEEAAETAESLRSDVESESQAATH